LRSWYGWHSSLRSSRRSPQRRSSPPSARTLGWTSGSWALQARDAVLPCVDHADSHISLKDKAVLLLVPHLSAFAGVAAVVGAIACRIFMGTVLDTIGPRFGTAGTVLCFAPAVFCISLVESHGGFVAARLFIGCSLCMFVCCQFWVGECDLKGGRLQITTQMPQSHNSTQSKHYLCLIK
jgi:MFS family permease